MRALVSKSEFLEDLEAKATAVSASLEEYFQNRQFDAPEIIVDAMKYSLFSSGKKIRPILVREFAALFGDETIVIPLADAIEMIHTYSLIHDDLPAMDDALLRRGKPTSHIAFTEAIAVLAGDALLNLAIERALEGVPEKNPNFYLNAVQKLFQASGVDGMIGGQTADIEGDTDVEYVESHKTGALISASVLCGALPFIELGDRRLVYLDNFSRSIGKAFQIVDDILDTVASEAELGKDSGADQKNETVTFITLYGLDAARDEVEKLRVSAQQALDQLGLDENHFLRNLTNFICNRGRDGI